MSYRNPRDVYFDPTYRLTDGQRAIINGLIQQKNHLNSHDIFCKALDCIKYSASGDDRLDNNAVRDYIERNIGWQLRLKDWMHDPTRREIFSVEGMD